MDKRNARFVGVRFDASPILDPTEDEVEFMKALDRYKKANYRPFPNEREILFVLRELGYSRESKLIEVSNGTSY